MGERGRNKSQMQQCGACEHLYGLVIKNNSDEVKRNRQVISKDVNMSEQGSLQKDFNRTAVLNHISLGKVDLINLHMLSKINVLCNSLSLFGFSFFSQTAI